MASLPLDQPQEESFWQQYRAAAKGLLHRRIGHERVQLD